jgi:Fe-S cluster biogenesis protein NfuA
MKAYRQQRLSALQLWQDVLQNKILVDTLTEKIEKALDEVRPFLANDGGDVSLVNIEGTTVEVQFHGACVGCKVSDFTLKGGIESTIKKYAPEIERVIAIEA